MCFFITHIKIETANIYIVNCKGASSTWFFRAVNAKAQGRKRESASRRVLAFIPGPACVPTRGFLEKPPEEGTRGSPAPAETKFLKKKFANFDFSKMGSGV